MKTRSISVNFLANATGTLVTIAVSILTVPIFVHRIGEARYGVLSIVWLLLGYFGFLDLGLSRASTNALARLQASSTSDRTSLIVASLLANLVIGCAGAVALYLAGMALMTWFITVPEAIKPEIAFALPWVAAFLPLALVSGVAVGILEASERFTAVNALQTFGAVLGQVAPVVAAILISPTLDVVVPIAVIARAAGVLLILAFVVLKEGPWGSFVVQAEALVGLFKYGGWVTVSSLVSPLLQSIDQFVIGSTLGVSAVTYYAIPMSLVTRSQFFAVALSRALFPRLSRLEAAEAQRVFEKATLTLGFSYAVICGPAIFLAKPFIALWISPAFADTAGPIAALLMLGAWINGLAFVPFSLLQARGRPDLTAKFHLLEVLPFLLILWFLTSHFGLIGAALAWVFRVALDAALLMWAAKAKWPTLLTLGIPAACLVACCFCAWIIPVSNILSLVWSVAAGTVLAIIGIVSDPVLRRTGGRTLGHLFSRRGPA
ncbi:flippase [Alsobacter soli]|uniref:Flippase n=1 Tax=Alsobacter soli TaxID=2109933 RepID=A0A2T1HNA2_9HYPH|nr:flippase [Alsobacter soli]PSC03135.1 flippase [Alsobacter soli]